MARLTVLGCVGPLFYMLLAFAGGSTLNTTRNPKPCCCSTMADPLTLNLPALTCRIQPIGKLGKKMEITTMGLRVYRILFLDEASIHFLLRRLRCVGFRIWGLGLRASITTKPNQKRLVCDAKALFCSLPNA